MASNIPIGTIPSIVPPVTIELRNSVLTRPWFKALSAWTAIALVAAAAVLLAGDELLVRARQFAEWGWHRPEGLILGSVALVTVLAAVFADLNQQADADKPIFDIR